MSFPDHLGKWRQCSTCVSWGGRGISLFFSALHHIKSTKATKESLVKSVQQTMLELALFGGRSLNLGHEKTVAFSSVQEKNGWWQKKCLCSTVVWVLNARYCEIKLKNCVHLCVSGCFIVSGDNQRGSFKVEKKDFKSLSYSEIWVFSVCFMRAPLHLG